MKINIAKSAGFCFGVKRAVDTVYKESSKKNVYTFGPIIHNDEVVADLERQGVHVINDSEDFKSLQRERLLFVLTACQKQFMMRSLMRVLI